MIKTIENSDSNNSIKKILKGAIVSILTTLFLLIIFSIILTYSKIQESAVPMVTIIISGISILIGGSLTTSNIRKNGMITGGMVGLIYIITIYLLSSIITKNFSFNTYSIVMIIVSVLSGGIGGIIGVNIK